MTKRRTGPTALDAAVLLLALALIGLALWSVVGCAGGPRVNDSVVVGDADTAAVVAKIARAETRLVGLHKEIQQHTYRRMDSGRDTTIGVTGGMILAAFAVWRVSIIAVEWVRCRLRRRLIARRMPPMID